MINKEEYFDVKEATKKVPLPSGYEFEIKKINPHELITESFPLKSTMDLTNTSDEKKAIIWDEMSSEEKQKQMDFNTMLIEKALIDPVLTNEEVNILFKKRSADYFALLSEVTSFSLGGAVVDPLSESKAI